MFSSPKPNRFQANVCEPSETAFQPDQGEQFRPATSAKLACGAFPVIIERAARVLRLVLHKPNDFDNTAGNLLITVMPNENKPNSGKANQLTTVERFKAVLFTVVVVAVMLVSLVATFYTWQFTTTAIAAPGTVIRLNAGGSHVQVQFTTAASETIEYAQNGMIGGYQVGDRVEVLYDPRDPKATAVINRGVAEIRK